MDEKEKLIQKLKDYFEKRDDVMMAFLFGSQAMGRARKSSDWDIGVYLNEEDWTREHEIWLEVQKLIGAEVDLVVLNRAPATIAWRIIGQGENLIVRDSNVFWDFLFRVSEEANAFYKTSEDYYKVFQRSASLSAGDKNRVRKIITFLEEEIKDYEKFRKLTWQEYSQEKSKKRDCEHWIEHLVMAVIDIAEIVLASERRAMPETYAEIVQLLGSVEDFDKSKFCEKLAQWVSLRNMLAHDYLDYRWRNISIFLSESEPLWQEFAGATKDYLSRN